MENYQYVKVNKESYSPGVWFNDKVGMCLKVLLVPTSSTGGVSYQVLDYTCNNYDKVFIDSNHYDIITKKEYEIYWNLYKEDMTYLINLLTKYGIT